MRIGYWIGKLRERKLCVRKLKNNKIGGSNGLVGELLKYDWSGMIDLLQQLFALVWREEYVPTAVEGRPDS